MLKSSKHNFNRQGNLHYNFLFGSELNNTYVTKINHLEMKYNFFLVYTKEDGRFIDID